jgi:hypothetical protein
MAFDLNGTPSYARPDDLVRIPLLELRIENAQWSGVREDVIETAGQHGASLAMLEGR